MFQPPVKPPQLRVVRDFVNKDYPGVKEWLKETKKRVGRTSSEGSNSIYETKLRKSLKKQKAGLSLGRMASTLFGGKHSPLHSLPWQMYYGGWLGEICQSQTVLQGVTLYILIPKKVTRKVRPTTDQLHVSTQCTRLSQRTLHQNYSLTPTLMIFCILPKGA